MSMKRNLIRPTVLAILILLAGIASSCNLYAPSAASDNSVSQETELALFTPLASQTPTSIFIVTHTPSVTPTASASPTPQMPTPAPKPATYTLQSGEFPYCIARRFNVHPTELLALNNLTNGMLYSPGLVLYIPQNGQPFPTTRALRPHPTTFTVPEPMTVYKAACLFGDVDPGAILWANNLTSPILTTGQILQIP